MEWKQALESQYWALYFLLWNCASFSPLKLCFIFSFEICFIFSFETMLYFLLWNMLYFLLWNYALFSPLKLCFIFSFETMLYFLLWNMFYFLLWNYALFLLWNYRCFTFCFEICFIFSFETMFYFLLWNYALFCRRIHHVMIHRSHLQMTRNTERFQPHRRMENMYTFQSRCCPHFCFSFDVQ